MKSPPFHSGRPAALRGWTLVEAVVVIVIVGVILSVGALVINKGFQAYFGGRDITSSDWQARLAFERMTRELRVIRSRGEITTPIATGSSIAFTDIFAQAISYSLSGTSLLRNGQPLADNVSSLQFSYLQSNGQTAATTSTNVYYITPQITVRTDTTNPGATATFNDTVYIRNFR